MGKVFVSFEPTDTVLTSDFDYLGKAIAEFLADLFPGVHVALNYRNIKPGLSSMNVAGIEGCSSDSLRVLRRSVTPVPGHDEWWRELSLIISEPASRFLNLEHPASHHAAEPGSTPSANTTQRLTYMPSWSRVPRELDFAAAMCENVSNIWASHVQRAAPYEMNMALSAQLPLWLISYIVAGLYYSPGSCCGELCNYERLARAIVAVIQYFENLADTRVEHQELTHGVVISPTPTTVKPLRRAAYPVDFKALKRTPLLADGVRTALWISVDGEPIGLLTNDSLAKISGVPEPVGVLPGIPVLLEQASRSLTGISLALRGNGSIMVFEKGRPVFIRRGRKWRVMLWSFVKEIIAEKYGEVGTVVFDAALHLSNSGHGGILGLLERLPEGIHVKDRVDIARLPIPEPGGKSFSLSVGYGPGMYNDLMSLKIDHPEWLLHRLLPSDKATLLGPSTIATLAAIDGATLFNKEGRLLAYGAIIPTLPTGAEGTRSVVARDLSKEGFVVKVSADGPLSLYEYGEEIMEV